MNEELKNLRDSICNSYSQVFFSDSRWFALALLLASFTDPLTGLSGLVCVVFALILLRVTGFPAADSRSGVYTYNVLLAGFVTANTFTESIGQYLLLMMMVSLLSLVLSIWLASLTARHKLPFLSLPFIAASWIITLNLWGHHAPGFKVDIDEENAVSTMLSNMAQFMESDHIPKLIKIYFKSMSGIFFQHNIIAGVVMCAGLLFYSRIAFTLSWLGFGSGYIFFKYFAYNGADFDYAYIGFNYIFAAIALGGFFIIPSRSSYLLAVVSTVVTGMLITAMARMGDAWQLPVYSLPFSVSVIIILAALNSRYFYKHLQPVQYQLNSPEKNLYSYHTHMERFKKDTYIHIHLPFYGEWKVSQAHDGDITHKDQWRFAWDFVVTDELGKTYRFPGDKPEDYYCYALPVIAPADGTVIKIEDGINDNEIGDVNLHVNWGNTIIIKHAEHLYSKISHIKNDSFKVKEGDAVKKGEMLALCGSSGRSPEPHLHFQLQATPYIGAQTLEYPLSYYISRGETASGLHAFDYPKEGEQVSRPLPTTLLSEAFHLVPGMKLEFDVDTDGKKSKESWEVFTNAYNSAYLYCAQTKSYAWFTNNQTIFYFTSFTGDKQSLLYHFYQGAYKVLLSYVPGIIIEDKLQPGGFYGPLQRFVQDFVAPFHIYLQPVYKAVFKDIGNAHSPEQLTIFSEANVPGSGKKTSFEIVLENSSLSTITVKQSHTCITARNIS